MEKTATFSKLELVLTDLENEIEKKWATLLTQPCLFQMKEKLILNDEQMIKIQRNRKKKQKTLDFVSSLKSEAETFQDKLTRFSEYLCNDDKFVQMGRKLKSALTTVRNSDSQVEDDQVLHVCLPEKDSLSANHDEEGDDPDDEVAMATNTTKTAEKIKKSLRNLKTRKRAAHESMNQTTPAHHNAKNEDKDKDVSNKNYKKRHLQQQNQSFSASVSAHVSCSSATGTMAMPSGTIPTAIQVPAVFSSFCLPVDPPPSLPPTSPSFVVNQLTITLANVFKTIRNPEKSLHVFRRFLTEHLNRGGEASEELKQQLLLEVINYERVSMMEVLFETGMWPVIDIPFERKVNMTVKNITNNSRIRRTFDLFTELELGMSQINKICRSGDFHSFYEKYESARRDMFSLQCKSGPAASAATTKDTPLTEAATETNLGVENTIARSFGSGTSSAFSRRMAASLPPPPYVGKTTDVDNAAKDNCNMTDLNNFPRFDKVFHWSIISGNVALVAYVVQQGFHLQKRSQEDLNDPASDPLVKASYRGHARIIKLLYEIGCTRFAVFAMQAAAEAGQQAVFDELVHLGVVPRLCLHAAAKSNEVDMLQHILNHPDATVSSSLNVNERNEFYQTPLHIAVLYLSLKAFLCLVKAKAHLFLVDCYNRNLLHFVTGNAFKSQNFRRRQHIKNKSRELWTPMQNDEVYAVPHRIPVNLYRAGPFDNDCDPFNQIDFSPSDSLVLTMTKAVVNAMMLSTEMRMDLINCNYLNGNCSKIFGHSNLFFVESFPQDRCSEGTWAFIRVHRNKQSKMNWWIQQKEFPSLTDDNKCFEVLARGSSSDPVPHLDSSLSSEEFTVPDTPPLSLAIFNDYTDTVKFLLSMGHRNVQVNVSYRDKMWLTPLHLIAIRGNLSLALTFADLHATELMLSEKDWEGFSAIQLAKLNDNTAVANYFSTLAYLQEVEKGVNKFLEKDLPVSLSQISREHVLPLALQKGERQFDSSLHFRSFLGNIERDFTAAIQHCVNKILFLDCFNDVNFFAVTESMHHRQQQQQQQHQQQQNLCGSANSAPSAGVQSADTSDATTATTYGAQAQVLVEAMQGLQQPQPKPQTHTQANCQIPATVAAMSEIPDTVATVAISESSRTAETVAVNESDD